MTTADVKTRTQTERGLARLDAVEMSAGAQEERRRS